MFGNPLLDPRGSLQGILTYGVFAVIVAIIFFMVAEEKPPKPPEPRVEEAEIPVREGFSRILRVRQFYVLSTPFFGGFWVYLGLTTWIQMIVSSNASIFEKALEVYLAQAYPLFLPFIVSQSQIQGRIVGALITLGGIIGCMVLPSLSDKLNRRKPFMVVSMLTIAPLVYMIGTSSGTMAATVAFTLGFFLLACPLYPSRWRWRQEK